MKPKNKIVRLRKKFPLLPSNQIAKQVGGSRQYVSTVLQKRDLPTSAPKNKKLKECLFCKELHSKKQRFCSSECRFKYNQIEVTCTFCHIQFYRARHVIDNRVRAGYNRIYCSRKCYYRGQRDGLKATYVN